MPQKILEAKRLYRNRTPLLEIETEASNDDEALQAKREGVRNEHKVMQPKQKEDRLDRYPGGTGEATLLHLSIPDS